MIVDNDDWRSMIWLILTAVNKNYKMLLMMMMILMKMIKNIIYWLFSDDDHVDDVKDYDEYYVEVI